MTESFCIAILEAASCGLFVVSTEVGGVPEVLPEDLILMGPPSVAELTKVLARAIREKIHVQEFDDEDGRYSKGDVRTTNDPIESHKRISKMYSWDRVASRTIQVYEQVLEKERFTFLQRLARYKTVGPLAGYVVCMIAVSLHFLLTIVEWWQPRDQIDVVPDLKPFDAVELMKEMETHRNRNSNLDAMETERETETAQLQDEKDRTIANSVK